MFQATIGLHNKFRGLGDKISLFLNTRILEKIDCAFNVLSNWSRIYISGANDRSGFILYIQLAVILCKNRARFEMLWKKVKN